MAHEFATPSEPVVNELAEIDHILTRPRDTPVRSADQLYCQLPPCSLVRKSRLESRRCDVLGERSPDAWPLLITATPRSGTVFMQTTLNKHGMEIQDDWHEPMRDGRVAWQYAFDDPDNFGEATDEGKRFRRVLHQVKEPLGSITSLCTEPLFGGAKGFIQRHIKWESSRMENPLKSRACLEMWVEWHSFLTAMRFPTYKVEEADMKSIYEVAGLGHLYSEGESDAASRSNHRTHREKFTWQDLYTIDPTNALKAWELAHYYGYNYKEDFNDLTCLEKLPMCGRWDTGRSSGWEDAPFPDGLESDKCQRHSENQYPKSNRKISAPSQSLGFNGGWVDAGCVEVELSDGTYIGVRGLITQQDLGLIPGLIPTITGSRHEMMDLTFSTYSWLLVLVCGIFLWRRKLSRAAHVKV